MDGREAQSPFLWVNREGVAPLSGWNFFAFSIPNQMAPESWLAQPNPLYSGAPLAQSNALTIFNNLRRSFQLKYNDPSPEIC